MSFLPNGKDFCHLLLLFFHHAEQLAWDLRLRIADKQAYTGICLGKEQYNQLGWQSFRKTRSQPSVTMTILE